jgi:hypothetical protein
MKPSRLLVRIIGLGAALMALSFLGCATPSRYTLHLGPSPEEEKGPKTTLTIGLLPFEDSRPSPQVLGKLIDSDGKEVDIVLDAASPAGDVTYILRRALRARDIQTVELQYWTPDPEHLQDIPGDVDVAFAGRIDALTVNAESALFDTKVKYRVRLSARLGFKKEGVVITQSAEVLREETLFRFNPPRIEETLNDAVAEALNRLLKTIATPPNAASS